METVYFTCLNNDCEKHRNVFVEGDPDHAHCARERLYLEGQQRRTIPWALIAVTAALGLGAAAFVLFRRARSQAAPGGTYVNEGRDSASWSADYTQSEERRGHTVPPPIS